MASLILATPSLPPTNRPLSQLEASLGGGGGCNLERRAAAAGRNSTRIPRHKNIVSWEKLGAKQWYYLSSPAIYMYLLRGKKFRRILHFFAIRTHTRRSSFWKFFFLTFPPFNHLPFPFMAKKDATSQQQQQQQQHTREAALQQRRHRSCFCSVVANQPNRVLCCNMRHSDSELVAEKKVWKKATMF